MNQGWQSEATDGLKGAVLDLSHSFSLSLLLSFSDFQPTYLPTYWSIYVSIDRSIYRIYLSFVLFSCQDQKRRNSARLSLIFAHNNVQNETILRDFFIFGPWQHPKRSNSARLLQFLNLTTSKTKQFCETSFKNGKVSATLTAIVPMRFAIFPLHLSKVLRLPRKIDARSYEVLHLSRKIILANLQIWCSKMQPFSGNQRPDLLTSLMNMSFVLCLPRKMHLCRSSSNVPRLPRGTTSERPKVVRTALTCVFDILTSKCASRHNGVHFFDISTSKSGPTMVCFVHFDFEMCFAPQRRALFRHLNFQKWSDNGVFLYILTSKCASRHNGVHFFDISTSKSGPKLRCFVHFDLEMCFAPQRRAIFHLSSGQLAPHPPL